MERTAVSLGLVSEKWCYVGSAYGYIPAKLLKNSRLRKSFLHISRKNSNFAGNRALQICM